MQYFLATQNINFENFADHNELLQTTKNKIHVNWDLHKIGSVLFICNSRIGRFRYEIGTDSDPKIVDTHPSCFKDQQNIGCVFHVQELQYEAQGSMLQSMH